MSEDKNTELVVMGRLYPRMQILSIPEIFDDRRFDTPGAVGRKAQQIIPLHQS